MPQSDFLLIAPELVLTFGALLLLTIAAFWGDRAAGAANWLAVAVLAAAASATFSAPQGAAFDGLVRSDFFADFARYLVFGAALLSLLLAPRYFANGYRTEYPLLVLLAALGMSIMVSANDLMTLYIGLEMNSLSAYVLASFMRNDARSSEAGLKYFVLGALASGMLLYGSSLLYGFSGTTSFPGIAAAFQADGAGLGLTFGLVFVLAGVAFKISAVPFHMWTPDVYEGAPTPVTAFFASAPKVAGMALLIRLCIGAMLPAADKWQQILIFLSIASMLLGAFGAIGQNNIKRLVAYSSIANVGFMLVGLAAVQPALGDAGMVYAIAAVLTYLLVYVVMTLGTMLAVLQLRRADGSYSESIPDLAGLARQRPGLAAALAVFMFSLAGIPPLFGFWPKLLVFNSAMSAGLFPLAIIGVLASVVGAFYYLRVIKLMYFDEPSGPEFPAQSGGTVEAGLMALAALFVAVLGWPLLSHIGGWVLPAAGSLL